LRPTAHQAEVSLKLLGTDLAFTGLLAVVPGALFADVESDKLRIFDPLGRDHAYLNYFSKEGRGAGMRVTLDLLPNGTSQASLPLPPRRSPTEAPRFALVSSEPDGRTPGTVGYPLDEPSATWDVVDGRLMDGGARAALRERKRRERVKGWILGYGISMFGLFLAVLFRKRVSDQERLDRFAATGSEAEQVIAKSPATVVPFVLVVAMVFLFSLGWALLSPAAN